MVDFDFWSDFGANMLPVSFRKSTEMAEELELVRHRISDRFLHGVSVDFPSISDAKLEILAPKMRPRLLQDGSQDEVRDIFHCSGDFG